MSEAIIFNLEYPILAMDNDKAGIYLLNADSAALFESIFKSNYKNLHIYAISLVKDSAVADEIVQNVFYKLWEKKEKVKIQTSITAYLYRSVYYESLNLIKHAKVNESYKKYVSNTTKDHESPGDTASLKQLQQKIDTALNELPEQCRAIFHLIRFEELKYRDVADKLGISVKTVENQMGKALRVLRTKLAEFLPVLILLFINLKNVML